MKTKKIWANLCSADLSATDRFYEAIGFNNNNQSGTPGIASFSFGEAGFIINFFDKDRFAANSGQEISEISSGHEILFSLSAGSREEVDQWPARIRSAGGTVYIEPVDYMGGYNMAFADPDGHKFNVFYMEGM